MTEKELNGKMERVTYLNSQQMLCSDVKPESCKVKTVVKASRSACFTQIRDKFKLYCIYIIIILNSMFLYIMVLRNTIYLLVNI